MIPAYKNVRTVVSSEFQGVQALRGLAACMVVVYHSTQLWSEHVGAGGTWFNGLSGVDIFFVISGFVMTVSTRGKKGHGPHAARDFMERRLVRLVPMYWLITFLTVLKLYAIRLFPKMENVGPHISLTVGYIVSSLLFWPYRNSLGNIAPIVQVG
jgi:exopolysaccharide production protein ExoZ